MFDRFKIHLSTDFQEIESKKLLLAISGGIDSIVMLDLFSKTNVDLALAHCNFKLRGEDSDKDESFVRSMASAYNIPFHIQQFDTEQYAEMQKCSIQMAARELRYEWFGKLLEEHHYDFVLTAHHADDNLETFLINLSRGTGIDGLCGIPEKTGHILRPLLPFSRDEIHNYALRQKLNWREDLSNQDDKYLRNKIRRQLVPLLNELNPSFKETFSATLDHIQGSRDIIKDRMKFVKKEVTNEKSVVDGVIISFKVPSLREYASNTAYLYQLFHPFGFKQFEDIRSLLTAQSGKMVLSNTHRLLKHGDLLLLSKNTRQDKSKSIITIAETQKYVDLKGNNLSLETIHLSGSDTYKVVDRSVQVAFFDKDLLRFPLHVRKWENGDYFYPFGMKGKKKISKFFKDEKYSLLEKENIWLLCSGSDIIWIIGKRIDDRYKVSNKSKTILKATLHT